MILYPSKSSNKYSKDCFIICITSIGEVNYTFYINKNGEIFKCGDWTTHKPEKVYLSELFKLTLDTPKIIESKWLNWMKENNYVL